MSIRDISLPEAIKKAEEFTEHIKDGTIKNPHYRIYRDRIDDVDIKDITKYSEEFASKQIDNKFKKYFITNPVKPRLFRAWIQGAKKCNFLT